MSQLSKTAVALQKISDHGECYIVNGAVRAKGSFKPVNIRKSVLARLIMDRHVTVDPVTSRLTVTSRGLSEKTDRDYEKSRQQKYYGEKRDRGYVKKSLWVHVDDLDKFERFVSCQLKP